MVYFFILSSVTSDLQHEQIDVTKKFQFLQKPQKPDNAPRHETSPKSISYKARAVFIIRSGHADATMQNVIESEIRGIHYPLRSSCDGDAVPTDSSGRGEEGVQISIFEVQIDENRVQLFIKHRLYTSISGVGLQLWRAAFLVIDFLVDQKAHLRTRSIIEFGCGVGLIGVVLKYLNHRGAFITDMNDNILSSALENLSLNAAAVPGAVASGNAVHCRVLDWTSECYLNISVMGNQTISSGGWTREDVELINSTRTLFIAADCVYDDDLTKQLFLTASRLMKPRDRMVIAIEKRYVMLMATQSFFGT
jgi:predicted nicotinamide N-methyase